VNIRRTIFVIFIPRFSTSSRGLVLVLAVYLDVSLKRQRWRPAAYARPVSNPDLMG
jgi:hypothetical protein